MEYAFFEGKFVPIEEANINIKTNSFHYGTAIFEGLRAYWNEDHRQLYILFAKEHFERLLKNAQALFMELPYTAEELVEITKELLRRNEIKQDVYIRPIVYFKDLALTIPSRWKVAGAYVNSALAKTEALMAGYDEALLLNSQGYVSEGSGENIFLIREGKAVTPAYNEHILEGITRKAVINLLKNDLVVKVEERAVARSELYVAEEIFLTGTAAEVTPVVEVDNRKVGSGKIGEITKQLQELYFNAVRGNIERYRSWLTPVYEK